MNLFNRTFHVIATILKPQNPEDFPAIIFSHHAWALMSRTAYNGETGKKSPAAGDLNWMPKVAPWKLVILAKMAILAKIARGLHNSDKRPSPLETGNFGANGDCSEIGNFGKNRQKCMQWRKWQKIASLWRFELDAKSGPLEAGNFGKNRQRAGDMWQNIQTGCQKWPLQSR